MQYTSLGRTALKVSRLCLGTMNFGPKTSEADSFRIMDAAQDLGINFFDTADVYGWKKGEGVTEQIIGRWFAQGGVAAKRWCSRPSSTAIWATGRTQVGSRLCTSGALAMPA
ncbi:MAG TPA: aldo/keto reductase [Capsulimonadaceae bacterium]